MLRNHRMMLRYVNIYIFVARHLFLFVKNFPRLYSKSSILISNYLQFKFILIIDLQKYMKITLFLFIKFTLKLSYLRIQALYVTNMYYFILLIIISFTEIYKRSSRQSKDSLIYSDVPLNWYNNNSGMKDNCCFNNKF